MHETNNADLALHDQIIKTLENTGWHANILRVYAADPEDNYIELQHNNGSMATGLAATIVIESLKKETK